MPAEGFYIQDMILFIIFLTSIVEVTKVVASVQRNAL